MPGEHVDLCGLRPGRGEPRRRHRHHGRRRGRACRHRLWLRGDSGSLDRDATRQGGHRELSLLKRIPVTSRPFLSKGRHERKRCRWKTPRSPSKRLYSRPVPSYQQPLILPLIIRNQAFSSVAKRRFSKLFSTYLTCRNVAFCSEALQTVKGQKIFPLDSFDSAVPLFQLHPVFDADSSQAPSGNTMSRFVGLGDKSWYNFKNSFQTQRVEF